MRYSRRRPQWGVGAGTMRDRRRKSVFCLITLILLCISGSSSYAASDSSAVHVSIVALPIMTVELVPGSPFFTITPDVSPSDTGTVQIDVCSNAPPTVFSISLLPNGVGPHFSYKLIEIGQDSIPVLPKVSSQDLPLFGCTAYVLELTAIAGLLLPARVYTDNIQLRFQILGIIQTFVLHIETTVLPRSPVVDAGSDQAVDEGDLIAFSGSYNDPDAGETYTIGWDFGDGTTASGTLAPTYTYSL